MPGATLAYGPQRYDAYGDDYLSDPAILGIAQKVQFELSEELTRKYYPHRFSTGVRMRFVDGSTRSSVVIDSMGTPRRSLSKTQVLAKGHGMANGAQRGVLLEASIWDTSQGGRSLAHALVRALQA